MPIPSCQQIQNRYLIITLLTTLSASFIWGINTLFLLDAGLTNTEAFAANAFFTLGMVIFEVPTGVVADTWGRRVSFLMGTVTLIISTTWYLLLWKYGGGFLWWVLASLTLGLGFTFFSGAVEAWVVDALEATGFDGNLDSVFAKSQTMSGIAMLIGAVLGGVIAQLSNLGVPFVIRAILLCSTFVFAYFMMKDIGFTPVKATQLIREMKRIMGVSFEYGLKKPSIRWLMLAAPFTSGVGIYAFYAMQPYLLQLWGDPQAFAIAGLAAAIVAMAQMLGGLMVPKLLPHFEKRTSIMLLSMIISVVTLFGMGVSGQFYLVLLFVVFWAIGFSATTPVRQSYLNAQIPSKQRATVLSFDSLMGSTGGIISQPMLGKAADIYSYGMSYLLCAALQLLAVPFILKAKSENAEADKIKD